MNEWTKMNGKNKEESIKFWIYFKSFEDFYIGNIVIRKLSWFEKLILKLEGRV